MSNFSKPKNTYILSVGEEASNRLDLLEKIYGNNTHEFLNKFVLQKGVKIAILGCGIGNMEIWIAQQIGDTGKVIASDISEKQLNIAKLRAKKLGVENIEFIQENAKEINLPSDFDIVCARFLLMHLTKPENVIKKMIELLKPGGIIFLEEVSCDTVFSDPENTFVNKSFNLMSKSSKKNKLDFNIGLKLFRILDQHQIRNIKIKSYQPLFFSGEEKFYLYKSVLEASPTLVENKLISKEELSNILEKLHQFTTDSSTLIGLPTTYQVCGIKA